MRDHHGPTIIPTDLPLLDEVHLPQTLDLYAAQVAAVVAEAQVLLPEVLQVELPEVAEADGNT